MTPGRRLRPLDPAPEEAPAYISQANLARRLGVSRATVTNWLLRHEDTPPPAATVDGAFLYTSEQIGEWTAWLARHPGRGHRLDRAEA